MTLQVSSGSASCPADGRESEELLQEADASLYRAKQRRGQAGAADRLELDAGVHATRLSLPPRLRPAAAST